MFAAVHLQVRELEVAFVAPGVGAHERALLAALRAHNRRGDAGDPPNILHTRACAGAHTHTYTHIVLQGAGHKPVTDCVFTHFVAVVVGCCFILSFPKHINSPDCAALQRTIVAKVTRTHAGNFIFPGVVEVKVEEVVVVVGGEGG